MLRQWHGLGRKLWQVSGSLPTKLVVTAIQTWLSYDTMVYQASRSIVRWTKSLLYPNHRQHLLDLIGCCLICVVLIALRINQCLMFPTVQYSLPGLDLAYIIINIKTEYYSVCQRKALLGNMIAIKLGYLKAQIKFNVLVGCSTIKTDYIVLW